MVIFMGAIIGAAALSVDVGRVYVLRNQSRAATSAAALAAGQAITQELNQEIASGNGTQSISNLSPPAKQAATFVYEQNIAHALPNQGLSQAPTVTVRLITTSYLNDLTSAQQTALQPYLGMVLIEVSDTGTTPMYFGGAVGVPRAKVTPVSAVVVGMQTGVPKNALLPLAMPATGIYTTNKGKKTNKTNKTKNTWEANIPIGTTFFAYRGQDQPGRHESKDNNQNDGQLNDSNGSRVPPLPPGTPSSAIDIEFHNLFGSGNYGILQYRSGAYVDVGGSVSTRHGSSIWNQLSNPTPGETIYLPVGNSTNNKSDRVSVLGFLTATVIAGKSGANAGFSFTITGISAQLPSTILEGFGSNPNGYAPTVMYRLVSVPTYPLP